MAVTLKAKERKDLTKSATKEIRRIGDIPGIVYGKHIEPMTISVNNNELMKTIREEGRNAIINLDIEGKEAVDVLLQDYQTDTVKGNIIHVDFFAVDLTEEIDVEVPVRLQGDAIGVKEGGVLQQPVVELEIRVKPKDIPDEIVVNVEALGIGDSISVADLPKSDKYEILEDPETVIATITAPDSADVTSEEAEDDNVEPELVGAEKEAEESE